MEIIKLKENQAPIVLELIKRSFLPLLEKYNDIEYSPATKRLESLVAEIIHPTSDTYLLQKYTDYIGYVRVNKRNEGEYSISDLCIDPFHQGRGHAQYFLNEIEGKYPDARIWSLVTILEEKTDCYLYEKLGYIQLDVLKEINPEMHLVLYTKDIEDSKVSK